MNIKNSLWVVLVFIFLAFTGFFIFFKKTQKIKKQGQIIKYTLNGKTYNLLLADEPEEWVRGLMYVRKPEGFDGMLFIFPDKKIRQFWNKNTFVDLDLYWFDGERLIGKSFLPSVEKTKKIVTVSSSKPVDKVVEIIKK